MKKINHILTLLVMLNIDNITLYAKSQNELGEIPLASDIDYTVNTKGTKLKRKNPLEFQPDQAFGGAQAQGKYDYKDKTATIIDGTTTYSFKFIKELPNPGQPGNKYNKNLIRFGSFINRITRGMPVTMYLFGQLVENEG